MDHHFQDRRIQVKNRCIGDLMKRYVIAAAIMVLLLNTAVAESPFKIIATVPPFVRPGDENVTIQLVVKLESGEYDDVNVELILPRFFSASKEGSDEFRLGDMSTTDIMKPPLGVAVFQVDISRDATYGDYPLQVYIKSKTGVFMDTFTMHVVGVTLVEVSDVVTSKDPIEPGDDFELGISVKNVGSNTIKWMKVILSPNPPAEVTGQLTSQLTQIPAGTTGGAPSSVIIPISSDLERVFKDVSPGDKVLATYVLSVEPDAESKNYAMAVTLVYQDETGMVSTESRVIGIKIKGTPNLEFQGIEADPAVPYNGEEVIISVTLENNGTAEARSVKVSIASPLGNYTSFIGTMKRNENNAAIFKILVPQVKQTFPQNIINNVLNRMETRKYPMTIQVYYQDPEGTEKGFAEGWELTTRTKQDITVFYIIGGAILLIIVVVWRLQSRRHLKALEE